MVEIAVDMVKEALDNHDWQDARKWIDFAEQCAHKDIVSHAVGVLMQRGWEHLHGRNMLAALTRGASRLLVSVRETGGMWYWKFKSGDGREWSGQSDSSWECRTDLGVQAQVLEDEGVL